MAKFTWSGAQDTNWFNPNNWNPAIVPTPGATVVIPTGLTNYPVVPNGNSITLNQDISLGGPLTLASTGSATDLIINGGVVRKFSGGGTLILSDSSANRIYSNQGGTVLENVNDTIAGAGQIYANSGLSILNDALGVINANATNNQLNINNISVTNNGLVEATGAAGLLLNTVTLDQSTGAGVLSANGGNVYLNRTTILGGTLQTPSGLIETAGNSSVLDGTGTHPITIATGSTVQISDGNNLTIIGTFNNKGAIKLASGQDGVHFDFTDLIVNGAITDKLQGGGTIQLSDSANNRIYSNNGGTVLENVDNTIAGAGQIFPNGGLSILNDAAGVINANATNNQLNINNISVTNNGLVEATGAAGLFLNIMTLDQSTGAGVLSANAGNVYLNRTTILGGTLQTPSGLIETAGNSSTLDGTGTHPVTIVAGSTVQINDGNNLTITGVINDKGVIKLASGQDGVHFDFTDLIVNGSIADKLQGGGVLQLSDSANNRIFSSNANTVLENVDDTITGAGQIFTNSGLSILNDTSGVINASAAINQLNINNIYLTNNGLAESTGAAGLLLNAVTFDQSTGAGVLSANGGNVYLNSSTILGGTLQTPSGLIETSGNNSILNGAGGHAVTVAGGSAVQVSDGTNLTIVGVINDQGAIRLVSGQDGVHFDFTDLIVNGSITDKLQGGGVLQLSDSANNRIFSNNAGTVLENVNDTIAGACQIFYNGGLSILNDASGVINASAAVNALNINNIVVNNAGLIESTSTGGLALNSMTLNNAGGTLSAAGGLVNLNASGIVGGTLSSSGVGRIQTSGNSSLLNGVTLAAGGSVWISDGNNLSITGTITNNGVISLRSGQNGVNFDNTDLLVQGGGTVTLTGGGTVQLVTGGANRIFSNQGGTILDNINNRITGSGQIFANSGLSVTNEAAGSITASNTAQTLAITSITVTNKGTINATYDATLTLNSMALNQSGAGVLSATQGNVFFNASHISGGAIASSGGYVVATNGNSTLLDGSGGALSITAGSTVRVSDGTNLSLTGTIANSGTLFVDSGQDGVHFDNTDLLIQGAVNLTGGGTVLLSSSANNRIFTNTGGSVLTNTNDTIIGGGQIFSNSGLSIVNAAAGVIEAGLGESLSVSVAIVNSGVLEGNGGALSVSGPVTGTGVAEVANGGSVTFSGATALGSVVFATPYAGTITLPGGVTPAITGWAPGDALFFNSSQPVTSLSYNAGVLSFLNGANVVESFALNGSYTTSDFQLTTGGVNVYGVTDQGDLWQGGTGVWSAGPWREGLPGAANDVVISSGAPTVAAGVGTVRSLSVLGAGSVDFAGVGGNAVSGAVYDASTFGLDSGAGEGGGSVSAGSVTVAPGGQLTIGNASLSASDQLTAGSIVNNGNISVTGAGANQALLNVAGAAGFGTVGAVGGKVSLTGNSAIEFASGGLKTVAAGSSLSLSGAGAIVEIAGHLGASSALTGLSNVSGTLSLENGAVIAPTGALYDSGVLNVDDVGPGGTVLTLPSLFVTGVLNIGNAGMTVADTVNVTSLRSVGAINLAGGASAQALLNVNAAAGLDSPAGRLFGAVSLSGHSALQFASGAITAIDGSASLRLQGANAFVQIKTTPNADSALATLGLDAGTLSLESGAHLADNSALNNTGVLSLDALPGEGGSSLSEALGLTNAKTLTVGNATLSAATTVSARALANTGTIAATGSAGFQALINISGAAGFGTASTLTGSVTLAGNAQIKFGSGGIATIANGASLDLVGAAALLQNNLAGTNTGLKTLSSVAGTLTLDSQATIASTSAIANTGVIAIDAAAGEGGSSLTTSGALTNSAKLTLGNGSLSASDLVKAASLNNTGTLTVVGGLTNQALVNIASAAGFGSAGVLSGTVSLTGASAIEFASGALTTVASGANLSMTGGSAFIETGATNTNSALSTLSADSGVVGLHNSVTIASSRGLTVNAGAQFSVDAGAGEGGSNVTFNGALANSGALTLGDATLATSDLLQATGLTNTGSLTLTGGAATQALLNVTHAAANLTGTVTLTNDAAIAFTSGSLTGVAAGASLTLDGPNAYIEDGAANANNALSALASVSGAFNLFNGGSVSTVGLTNAGQIQVEATRGTGLNTSMSFSGLLKNTGSFTMLAATGTQANVSVSATSLYNTGSISLANGNANPNATLLTVAGAAGFGTANFVTGAVTIGADSAISFASGGITSIAKGATLDLAATNGFLEIGASNSNSALTGLSAIAGTLQIDTGSAISTTASLNNSGTINVDTSSGGGGMLSTTGGLTNSGALNLGAGYNLASSAQISAASINNIGSITLSGGAVTQALLRINGAAGFGSAGVFKGVATLYNDAAIQFNSGAITSVAAGSTLRLVTGAAELEVGASSPTNALATLGTIAGTLDLDNGAGISDSAALSITGGLFLDSFAGEGGSSMSNTNVINNSGTLDLGNTSSSTATNVTAASLVNTGSINLTGNGGNHFAELNVTGTLTNNGAIYAISDQESIGGTVGGTGTFDIWNNANLSFAAAVGTGQTVTFDTAGTLGVNATGNVFQAAIAGFGSGDAIQVSNFAGSGANWSYLDNGNHTGVLTVSNNGVNTQLNFAGDYTTASFSVTGNATTATLGFV